MIWPSAGPLRRMDHRAALLIDFGSTYTKLTAVDMGASEIIGKALAPTTVKEDIMIGLQTAVQQLEKRTGKREYRTKLASSSAAGGLKMVASGLVPELTLEAAKSAALGAGANLTGNFAYELSPKDIARIEAANPDVILLCGGTDGGNKDVVLHNADMLSCSKVQATVIYAGNRAVAEKCRTLLEAQDKEVIVTENVMPKFGELNVDKVREAVRDLFIKRIVKAKGLGKAKRFVDSVLMPTPAAILRAAVLIAEGSEKLNGVGDLVVVDVGGATTDVHSVGWGPVLSGAVKKSMPEPYAKRTVEGDLGVRYNAGSMFSSVGQSALMTYADVRIPNLQAIVQTYVQFPERLPQSLEEQMADTCLAGCAVDLAMERHAGTVETVHLPLGDVTIQRGKNLLEVQTIIGTGGPIIRALSPRDILEHAVFRHDRPYSLKPRNPKIMIDAQYLLYAVGLLSVVEPNVALHLAQKYLKEETQSG